MATRSGRLGRAVGAVSKGRGPARNLGSVQNTMKAGMKAKSGTAPMYGSMIKSKMSGMAKGGTVKARRK